MKHIPILIAAFFAAGCIINAETFFVSTNGNDANPGSFAQPFATPAKARDAIRAAKKKGAVGPFAVELRGGVYALAETLSFTPEDSGSAAAPVVWRSYTNEKALVSGGRIVTGIAETSVNGRRCWKTVITDVRDGRWYFRQLFVSPKGDSMYLRRFRPHIGMHIVAGLTDSEQKKAMAHRAAQKDFVFYPGDIREWNNRSDVEIVALHEWSSSRLRIERIDMKKNIVEFTGFPTFRIGHWWPGAHNPYFVENVEEALDEPGEWYIDRKTGAFTYLPMEGETLRASRIIAPALPVILAMTGDYSNRAFVSHIIFSNIVFAHNDSPLPREGYGGSQGHPDLPAAIELVGAEHCSFIRSTIAHTGNYGLSIGLGCPGDRVTGCRIFDLSGGGIKVGDIRMNTKAEYPELPTDNVIENSSISDGGIMYFSANAIWAGIVRGTVIRHNDIANFAYAGIAVGWSWNDTPTSCASNIIEQNMIRRVCTLLADGASIYTLGRQPGTIIRGNVLRDNEKSPFAREHWQLGLYLDEGSSQMLVENNIVYRVGTHGFNMNGGAENIIRNNILGPVYGNHAPYIRCYKKPYARSNTFTHNISFCDSTNLADDAWDKALFDCSSNIYWNIENRKFAFMGKSFAEWQASGQDRGSIVADPLYEAPERMDYRLKMSSPAKKIGFKPFEVTAGLQAAYKDVAVSMPVTRPPVYAMKMPDIPESILAPAVNAVSFTAKHIATPPRIDGVVSDGEWPAPIVMEETPMRVKITTPPCSAFMSHDNTTLYCAVSVPCDTEKIKKGSQWGASDGVEICIAAVKGTMLERVFVLHGFSDGGHTSVPDGGANTDAVKKMGDAVRHAAKTGNGRWVSEWAIPLASLGVTASPGMKLGFNIGVRRTEKSEWVNLVGTRGATFQLYNAGYCVLE